MDKEPVDIEKLTKRLRRFATERNWEKFHSPKNIAMAMAVEAAEVMEIFQWLTEEQSRSMDSRKRELLADEIGDVFIYLMMLADKCGIDMLSAADAKIEKNSLRFKRSGEESGAYTEYGEVR